jgi:hypothetical protein
MGRRCDHLVAGEGTAGGILGVLNSQIGDFNYSYDQVVLGQFEA